MPPRDEHRMYFWGKSSPDTFTMEGFYGKVMDDPDNTWTVTLKDELDRRAEAEAAAEEAAIVEQERLWKEQ